MISFRWATSKDIVPLQTLDPIARREADRRTQIFNAVKASQCLVATDGFELAGFAIINDHFFHQQYIELIVVAAERQRRGVGIALVDHLVSITAGKLWTSTNLSNTAMRALLQKSGFVASGQIEHLDDGDPELIFVHLKRL